VKGSEGCKMEVLTAEEVRKRFGPMFCNEFYTIVDKKIGRAQIIEGCIAKGPIEWDAVNRKRAGGIVESVEVDGTRLCMNVKIGKERVSFGPSSRDVGAQALEGLEVVGDEVETIWLGLAGASVGIGACLAQAPGVVRAEYDDISHIGGAHKVRVKIVTKKMIRMLYSIDDTDTKEGGATWALALKMSREPEISNVGKMLEHRIVQLNPYVKEKTTNCCATVVSFAVEEPKKEILTKKVIEYVAKNTFSKETCVAYYEGLSIPRELVDFGLAAKNSFLATNLAFQAADKSGAIVKVVTGERGAIGAVAGLGCFDLGLKAASLPTDNL